MKQQNRNTSGLIPGGKDYKYKGQETCDLYVELSAKGYCDTVIAAEMGVTCQSFRDWEVKHEEFAAARLLGRQASEAWNLRLGQAIAAGKIKNANFNAWRWFMKNKFGYTDSESVNIGVDGGVKVEFVSANKEEKTEE